MTFDELREELERRKWPDGRSVKDITDDIIRATSFLDEEVSVQKMSQRLFCLYSNITEIPKCPECGSNLVYTPKKKHKDNPYSGWSVFCSVGCSKQSSLRVERQQAGMMKNHGVRGSFASEELREKSRTKFKERTGYDHPMRSPEHKNKMKDSMLFLYGGYTFSSKPLSEASQQTMQLLYGTPYPQQNESIRKKTVAGNIDRYGVGHHNQKHYRLDTRIILSNKDVLEELYIKNGVENTANLLGVSSTTVHDTIAAYGIEILHDGRSFIEKDFCSFFDSLGVEYETSNRTILGGRELDVYLPDHNLAFEFNGLYWHSSLKVPRNYHQKKSFDCLNKNIRLIHIWQDDWKYKRNIVENLIRSKLKMSCSKHIYARNTTIKPVDSKLANKFMENNHIQGKSGGSVRYGLFHEGCLVALLIMKRTKEMGVYNLVRYATSNTIVGGFSKLLKHFKKNHEWKKIITFADWDISDGDLYKKTGFTFEHITDPPLQYVDINKGAKVRREGFMKHKLVNKLENFDPTLTEKENMENHGYLSIYTSGLLKFVMYK